jgi:putative peptidoglycan lipid II flippase
MKKLFGPLGAGGGALLLATANLCSYGAGLVRDLVLANTFGAGASTDAFFAGFLIPDFLFHFLVLGFVSGALLPIFLSAEKKSASYAQEVFQSFFLVIILCVTIFSVLAYVLTPFLVDYFFSVKNGSVDRSPQELEMIVKTTRILLLSPILFGISNTLGMILLAKKRFFSLAISPVLYNVGIIGGIVFFGEKYGIEAACWGAVAGAFLHLCSRLFDFPFTGVKMGFSFRFSPDLKKIFLLGIPKTIGLVSFQLTLFSFAVIASQTAEGGIAAWNFARNIQSLPVSLFGIAFATAALPFLSDFSAERNAQKYLHRLQKSASQILFFTVPAAVGLILVSNETIAVLLEHGAFDAQAKYMTVVILIGIAFAIPFESLTHLFSRAFLARKNTVTPAMGKILFLIVAVTVATQRAPEEGVSALATAFASAAVAEIFFLLMMFHRRVMPLPVRFLWGRFWQIGLLALMNGFIVGYSLIMTLETNEYFQLVFAVFSGGVFYLFGAWLLKMPELMEMFLWRKGKKMENSK